MSRSQGDVSGDRVMSIDAYRGFVFASLSPTGPSLSEFLGEAKIAFDDMCDRSPVGEVEVVPVCHRVVQHSNWKFFMENQLDALHPSVTHQSTGVSARRIEERVPTAYLLGEAWFCGLPFIVDQRVLIPRSPIAELIEQHFEPWLALEPARILDLCTGSGCIGIACAYEFPEAEVVLGDLSYEALEVANQNIERHGLDERVYTVQGDGFAGLPGQRFDLIVSNPPYVDAEDFADMPAEYQHEPALGLACGEDGLNLVRRMLAEAADHLTERGLLIVEVGNSQVHVEALYPEVDFTWLEFERGGHGVFLLAAAQCREHQALFSSRVDG
mgnify:CR=1 FL=1